MSKTMTVKGRVTERSASAAFEKVDVGLRRVMAMARGSADRRRWRDAAEDVLGALGDLAPDLRVLRRARRHGVHRRTL